MRSILHPQSSILAFLLLPLLAAAPAPHPKPLPQAHAHNDYEHPRPLQGALDHGFCNVEADIHLVANQLLVGHNPLSLRPDRTLQSLYLDPLKDRVAKNNGHVYPDGPTLTLLIDVKSDPHATYLVLRDVLKTYAPILTAYHKDGSITPGPIRVIISGNRDRKTLAAEDLRYAAIDGRPADLTANPSPPPTLVPWISPDWKSLFKSPPDALAPEDAAKLKSLVSQAHAQHRQLRFWNTPDTPATWKVLKDAGVDLLNTDDLDGMAKFLQ
jgi:hypothetical protein